MAITTAMPNSFKAELLASAHCFGATINTTGDTHSNDVIDNIATLNGITVGMTVSQGAGDLVGGTVVADIVLTPSLGLRIYPNATGTHAGGTLTFSGDLFKLALIRHAPVGTYDATTTNYSNLTANTDEVLGSGYTAGGLQLTNVAPVLSGTTAFVTFGSTISWTSASIDADGCLMYNLTNRMGGAAGNPGGSGRAIYVGDFGGRQQVVSGTFTIVMPTADATHALLRLQ